MKLIFLGTGGGRFVMARQLRSTGGFQLEIDNKLLHVDPGPGTLLRYKMSKLNPAKLDAVLVSHNHPDHCVDASALVEAMTSGTSQKRGNWIVNPTFHQYIDDYHRKIPKKLVVMKPADEHDLGVKIKAIPCKHTDPETIGFHIRGKEGSVYYTADTGLLPEHLEIETDVIIANLTAIHGDGRMGIEEHIKLAEAVQPLKMIITHFGVKVLRYGPEKIAREIRKKTGVDVMAARDDLELEINLAQRRVKQF